MRGYYAFIKKEFKEQIRTYRLMIMLCVFFLLGMISPLFAKLMPEIVGKIDMQGIKIIIPEPTSMDAYSQFFKNVTQMGFIIILLVFGSIVSNELTKGTLINILAKGLSRSAVILAKYTAALALWTVSIVVAAITNYGYTVYLFDDTGIDNLFFSVFCLWLFGAFILSLIVLSGTLLKGSFGGLIMSTIGLGSLLILNIFPKLEKINPLYLASHNLELLTGVLDPSDYMKPLLVTVGLLTGAIFISIRIFGKKKL